MTAQALTEAADDLPGKIRMDTSFPLTQTLCYQQAARLMAKGASLSMALRGCRHTSWSRTSTATRPVGRQSSPEVNQSSEPTRGAQHV
jgi:hypothetical protein